MTPYNKGAFILGEELYKLYNKIHKIVSKIDEELSVKDKIREETIRITRTIIRRSSECVKKVLENNLDEAKNILDEIDMRVRELNNLLRDNYPDIYYSGLVYGALAEYTECSILYSLVVDRDIKSYNELDIPITPYLQGLGDVVGELRRMILNKIMEHKIDEALEFLKLMEMIYDALRRLHYPDALIQGVRHKVDVARRLIDDTKAFLIDIRSREELRKLLSKITLNST